MRKNDIPELNPVEIPPVQNFLDSVQRDGSDLCAEDIYEQTMSWLRKHGCVDAVSRQIVEQYAMSVARWVHLEQMISKYGYIAKHPTTGAPMQSPYVTMAQVYAKQIIDIRAEINRLIKDSHPARVESIVREVVYGA